MKKINVVLLIATVFDQSIHKKEKREYFLFFQMASGIKARESRDWNTHSFDFRKTMPTRCRGH